MTEAELERRIAYMEGQIVEARGRVRKLYVLLLALSLTLAALCLLVVGVIRLIL